MQVDVDDPAGREVVEALAHGATEVDLEPVLTVDLAVQRDGEGFVVTDRGDELSRPRDAEALADEVHARVHRRAFEFASLQGWVRVHGVLATVAGRRVLVTGSSGAGKTTLALGLLARGARVDGDESVLLLDGRARAVPRRFHVKAGSVEVVPAAATWLADAPRVGGSDLRALDPRVAGGPWELRAAPLDDVVLLERSDGPSSVDDATTPLLLDRLRAEVFRTVEPRRVVVRQVAAALAGARLHHLRAGPDGAAPDLLAERLGRPARAD